MKKTIILAIFILFILNNIFAQRYYLKDGKFGALSYDGTILTEPIYDTVFKPSFAFSDEFLITKISQKQGLIIFPIITSPIIIEPKFDSIYTTLYNEAIILKQKNKYGFIVYSGKYRLPYVSESITPHIVWLKDVYVSNIEYDDIRNFLLVKNNKCGLILNGEYSYGAGTTIAGYRIIPAIYDTLIYYKEYDGLNRKLAYPYYTKKADNLNNDYFEVIKVINDGFINYFSVNMTSPNTKMYTLFPFNTYKDEELSYADDGVFIINQLGKPLQLYNVIDSTFKIISDEQGKVLILDMYYRFKGDRLSKKDPVCIFYGESRDSKNFITLFTNINKKENSLIFKDTLEPVYKVDYHDYFRYAQIYGRYGSYYGVDKQIVQQAGFTAFISSVTDRVENLSIKDFTLLSFPDKKVVYSTSFNSKNESIKINYPNPEKLDCCCPYFQIVKFITKDDKYNTTKRQVLGYINYKTFQFSKKRPEGCEDEENRNGEKMYKE